jgi:hypothetical protein
MSLVAIGGLVDMGMERELESQLTVRATRLAQSQMGDVASGYQSLTSTSGNFTYDSDWSYNTTVAAAPQGQPNLYLVTVTVSRDYRGKQFQYVLNQIILDPQYTGSAQAATSTTDAGSATPPASGSTGGAAQ